jgi:hypothetical protein
MAEPGAVQQQVQRTVAYQTNYDKETEHKIEESLAKLIGSIAGYCTEVGSNSISDPIAVGSVVGEIQKVLTLMQQLFDKYHEDSEYIQQCDKKLNGLLVLDGKNTITVLKYLNRLCVQKIALRHRLMDRVDVRLPWEIEVKKKFWLLGDSDFEDPQGEREISHEAFAQKIRSPWQRFIFYSTAFMVLRHGDIVALGTGINDSGKTNTAIPSMQCANFYLRTYWNVSKFEDRYVALDRFKMSRDVLFYPDAEMVRSRISQGTQFNCIGVNEGMKAAVNVRSWDPEVIDMILETFTERASHNWLQFEYQLAKRPPKMLLSRFNVWWHKMSQKWLVLSMPSSIYRTEDPLLIGEVEKLRGDRKISKWFTKKSKNANYIGKFRSPKMKPEKEAKFKELRKIAKIEFDKGKKIRNTLNNVWYVKLEEVWNMVDTGKKAKMAIPEYLVKKYNFAPHQVSKFMKDLDNYDKMYKITHPRNNEEEQDEGE